MVSYMQATDNNNNNTIDRYTLDDLILGVEVPSNDDGYNGWRNRQTWVVSSHFANDDGMDKRTREWASEALGEAVEDGPYESHGDFRAAATRHLAEVLETLCVEALTDEPPHWAADWAKRMFADAQTLRDVNWRGIADRHIDEALENWSYD